MILFIFIITAFNFSFCMHEKNQRTRGPILRQLIEENAADARQTQTSNQQKQIGRQRKADIDSEYFSLGPSAISAAQRPPFAKK